MAMSLASDIEIILNKSFHYEKIINNSNFKWLKIRPPQQIHAKSRPFDANRGVYKTLK